MLKYRPSSDRDRGLHLTNRGLWTLAILATVLLIAVMVLAGNSDAQLAEMGM